MRDLGESVANIPEAGQGSGHSYLKEALSQPGTYVSPPLCLKSPAPIPPWPLPPSDSVKPT